VFETAETTDGKPVRQVFIAIPQQGPVRYVLQAEISLLPHWATRNGLVILLIIGSATILLVAWIGSGWLAKKVLTPIEVLSTGAETMSEADLGKRFTLDSPYQEFRRLTQAFNSVMDRFQRSGEIQRRFCDIAAHEMKTSLTI
jgi:methyl-accepting chemotaxis protein